MKYLVAALTLLLCGSASAQDFHVADFRAARAAAVTAVNAGDFTTAEARLAQARAMVPGAPSILLLGAQIEAVAAKPDAALAFLRDYAGRGLWFDRTRYPDLAAIIDPDLAARLDDNAAPLGTVTEVARSPDLSLVEGLAVADNGQIYASSVHDGAVNRVANGKITPLIALQPGQGGYGLAVRDDRLWLAVASNAVSKGYTATTALPSEIVAITPETGRMTHFPADGAPRSFGDIGLGKNDLYTSDGANGGVFRLTGYTGPWQTLIASGTLGSPQDMVENAGATALVVADYTSGLYRIDLATGHVETLAVPADASLVGIDGMAAYGNDLIAVQNGVTPARVLRLHMSPDWQTIDSVEVLLRSSVLDQPTGGEIVGNDFIFVARSQWSDFDDDGHPVAGAHGPVIIADLKLQP